MSHSQSALDYIDMLNVAVRDADFVSANRLRGNAAAFIENALALIDASPQLLMAARETVAQVESFADMLTMTTHTDKTERVRSLTGDAIKALRSAIGAASPSARAKMLGL